MVFQRLCVLASQGVKQARTAALPELRALTLAGLTMIGLLLGLRQVGGFQRLELVIYDQMVRLRPVEPPDPRLVIVAITEQDIRWLKQWPASDRVLARCLRQLQRHQPKIIGLDLFRDVPIADGTAELRQELQRPNVIGVNYLGTSVLDAIPAPPGIPPERVGFSDIVIDPDGVVRRNLMFAADSNTVFTSFATQVALHYLEDMGSETAAGAFQLRGQVFEQLQPTAGGYQTIDAAGYQLLLNYRSPDAPAHVVTLTQVLADTVNPDWIRDRVVLIGVTAPSLKDMFFTPYSATVNDQPKMPGVMVHAQMVSQVIAAVEDGRPLAWFWPDAIELIWVLGWAMVGGILAGFIRSPVALGLAGTLLLSLLFGVSLLLFWQGGWVPIAAPAMGAIAVGSLTVAFQTQQARQQQKTVMTLLGQQASPEVAKALWLARDRLLQSGVLAGQSMQATILFTDIKGFSSISEQRPPEQVMSWLNEYMKAMTQEVHAHQGIINKFMGDGLMAVFGVPVPRLTQADIDQDAQRAVACALAMGERLQQLNQSWQERQLPVIQMRAGIYTGEVVAGSLGDKTRLEYAVIGDSVNIASRLESCEKHRQPSPCRILIARQTLDRLAGRFRVEDWGCIQLRGKRQQVEVYRVLSQAADS